MWNILYSDKLKFYHVSNISVAEILKLHGKWLEATPFVELVSNRQRISARYAYIKIKKAFNNNEILKVPLPNRRVLYGLPEFGPTNPIISLEHKSSNVINIPSKWKTLKERSEKFGGYLLDLQIRKLKVGERDPETGWPKENYDQVIPIQGIIVPKGATDLAAAIPITIPEKYGARLFTPSLFNKVIREDNQLFWSDKLKLYKIKEVTQIFDGYDLSYIIAKLIELKGYTD